MMTKRGRKPTVRNLTLWGYTKTNGKYRVNPEKQDLATMIYFFACLMAAKGESPDLIAETLALRYGLSSAEAERAVFDILEHRNIYESGGDGYPRNIGIAGMMSAFVNGYLNEFGGEMVMANLIDAKKEVWLGLCEADNPQISAVRNVMLKVVPKGVQLSFVVPPNISPCKGFYRKLLEAVKPTNIIMNDDRALFPWFNDYQDFLSVMLYNAKIPTSHLHIVSQHYEKKVYRDSQFDWYIPQYPWSEKKGSNNGETV